MRRSLFDQVFFVVVGQQRNHTQTPKPFEHLGCLILPAKMQIKQQRHDSTILTRFARATPRLGQPPPPRVFSSLFSGSHYFPSIVPTTQQHHNSFLSCCSILCFPVRCQMRQWHLPEDGKEGFPSS